MQKRLDKLNRNSNKTWVHKGNEFYNKSKKLLLQDNNIEIFSTYNEGKSVVAERFIKTLKNRIYKYTISVSKNKYVDKFNDILDEYTAVIKIQPIEVTSSTHFDFEVQYNDKDHKFKVRDNGRI